MAAQNCASLYFPWFIEKKMGNSFVLMIGNSTRAKLMGLIRLYVFLKSI